MRLNKRGIASNRSRLTSRQFSYFTCIRIRTVQRRGNATCDIRGNGNEMVQTVVGVRGKVRVAESSRGSRKGEVEYFRVVAFWKRILQQRSNPNLHGNLCHLEA